MGALLRSLSNLLAVALALALLGVLLLASSGGDDRRQQLLDHSLRELREIGTAMQSEVVTADGLELDVSDRFGELETAFGAASSKLDEIARGLDRDHSSAVTGARKTAFNLFNLIDSSTHERAEASQLAAESRS